MRRIRPIVLASCVLVVLAGTSGPPADASAQRSTATAGSQGAGDPYYPLQGNGGYNVDSYDLHISYTPSSKHLSGHATLHAHAIKSLSAFDLDLRDNLKVSSVEVDGAAATFAQPSTLKQELVITPPKALADGHHFTVEVAYAGTVKPLTDPDGSLDGFIPTDDGAFVADEPQGSPTWFPVNDSPRDKAVYSVAITVPKGLVAVSDGFKVGTYGTGATRTFAWKLTKPVSSYLVTATIGKFDVTTGTTPGGVPYYIAVDPNEKAAATPVLAKLPAIVDYFSAKFGHYPFGEAGAIVDNARKVGYALEVATRPLFDRAPDVATLSHELAHQWFGDDVTLHYWRDIWLNEGFAEFCSWLWDEHSGGKTAAQHFADLMALPASSTDEWLPPPGDPGSAANVFSTSVYDRGAATLEALRMTIGSTAFFSVLKGWVAARAGGNPTVKDFIAYTEMRTHRDLTAFFDKWLYKAAKP